MSRRKRYTRNVGRTLPAPLAARTTVEWLRFEHEHEPYGVFSYLDDARAALPAAEKAQLDELRVWFGRHLHAPELVSKTGSKTEERFWFRAEASEHALKARAMADLVRKAGIPIVERRTRRVPGRMRWEDGEQVAVITYRDAPRPRRRRSSRPR